MQTESNLRITFNPGGHVLLDFRSVDGSLLSDEIETGIEQASSIFAAIGSAYASASADGGSRQPIAFTRTLEHADRATALTYQWTYPRLLPFMVEGTLTVELRNGPTFDLYDAVLLAAMPRLSPFLCNATDTMVRLTAGRMVPTAGLPLAPGFPLEWYLTNCTDIATACADL